MNIYLMRHAIAVDSNGLMDDSQRKLTVDGIEKLEKITRNLRNMDFHVDYIFTSPYLRAQQTAQITANHLGTEKKRLITSQNLKPDGSFDELVKEINAKLPAENFLIVGHEPYLSQLISLLIGGNSSTKIQMKKAGICHLAVETLTAGSCAVLVSLMTPKQLMFVY